MAEFTDTDLWNQLRNGDEKAMYTLYHQYYDELLRYGLKICGDINNSKEYINLLYIDIWVNRQKLPEVNHPKAYVITSYKNKVLQELKKHKGLRLVALENSLENNSLTGSIEETIIELQDYEILKQKTEQLLKHLTERQRELLKLRFIEEMSYEAIAAHLNISVRTVYNSIHESIKALRKLYEV